MSRKSEPHMTCPLSTSSSSSSTSASASLAASPQTSRKRTRLVDINSGLTCILCNGYFIDAATIVECLHSFCKSCIVQYLEINKCCPICEIQVHKTKPLSNIRSDKALQDIIYKLIPDVFKNEMQRRREFYSNHPEAASTNAEDRGELPEHKMFYMPHDKISLSLEYGYGDNQIPENGYRATPANQQTEKSSETETKDTMRRYLLCPAGISILHLKKFIATKYGLPNTYKVDIMYLEDILSEDYTLMDVAYIYAWRRSDPMRLFYRICERPIKRLKTTHPHAIESKSGNGSSVTSVINTNTNSNLNNSNNNTKVSQSESESKLAALTSTSQNTNNTTNNTTNTTNNTTNTSTTNTSNTSAANTGSSIMTGAATTLNLSNSNNSKASGVTSSKGSTATPKNADTLSAIAVNTYRVTQSPTAATPQGISKSVHKTSSHSQQTDEPPKKLRKILPANTCTNLTTTPKPVQTIASITITTPKPLTTSSSTVNSLRQCRINTDKSKSLSTNALNNGLSAASKSSKEEVTKCVSNVVNVNSEKSGTNSAVSAQCSSQTTASNGSVNKKNGCSRKSSSFDVRTLIGTKSPPNTPHPNFSMNETEINNKNSAAKSMLSVRELNRNTVTSSSRSMPTTSSTIVTKGETEGINKSLSNSSAVTKSRPPTNSVALPSLSPEKVTSTATATSRTFVPLKITKSGTFVSPKQLNAKSLKVSQNETVNKSSKDAKCDAAINKHTNKSNSKSVSPSLQTQTNKPHKNSSPLSPPSIRIKLPTQAKIASASLPNKISCSSPTYITSSKTQIKITESNTQKPNVNEENSKSKTLQSDNTNSQQSQAKSAAMGQSGATKTSQPLLKGASINQIVNKIASGVTAKSVSVNVTSTTPTLELNKTKTVGTTGSAKITANEVNDDKVSTTTNESGVSSSVHKIQDESAIKAVTSATTNTGNLVIRISTKSAQLENCANAKVKDKSNKFEIKKETHNAFASKPAVTAEITAKTDESIVEKNSKNDANKNESNSLKFTTNSANNDGDDDDDDNSLDGRKLVVDVPNDDSCENEVGTTKVTLELDDIDSGRGSDIIRLSCDDIDIGSPQSTTLSIKTPESLSALSDGSSKQSSNLCSTTLSTNSAVLVSPPHTPTPTPTPSPKSESDNSCLTDIKSNKSSTSSPPNCPLDLSTNRKETTPKAASISGSSMRAIYDIPPPKPKHCVNPAVLDKHRGLFPPSSAPNKQHPSFKILANQSTQASRNSSSAAATTTSTSTTATATNFTLSSARKEKSVVSGSSQSQSQSPHNHSRNHHHHHHHNHKNYSVITPDPHRYTPKIVIRNIGSPPSITSQFNYNHNNR